MSNTKTKTNATHAGICSVCFNEHKLNGEKPTRHGFSAHNVRHGQSGGWHSGPCFGTVYPHFGISCEGTKVALARVTSWRDSLVKRIEEHAARPALVWTRKPSKVWGRPNPLHKPVDHTINPGDKAEYLSADSENGFTYPEHKPSYDDLWTSIERSLAAELERTEQQIKFYTDKINGWRPAPARELAPKVDTVHLETQWKGGRHGDIRTGTCSKWSMTRPAVQVHRLTTDPAKVTCQRCLKAMAK
jgi:hypothetical protein